MTIAILTLAAVALVELFIIISLMNRLLAQAHIKPIEMPKREPAAEPMERPKPTKIFSVPIA